MKKVLLITLILATIAAADNRLRWSDMTAEGGVTDNSYWYACRYEVQSYGYIVKSAVYFQYYGTYSLAVFGNEKPHKQYYRADNLGAATGWCEHPINRYYTEQSHAIIAVRPISGYESLGYDTDYPHHSREMLYTRYGTTPDFKPWGTDQDLMIHLWVRLTSGAQPTSLGRIRAMY